MIVIIVVLLGLSGYWVYLQKATVLRIYRVQSKKSFIYSRGNRKILFDSLAVIDQPSTFSDMDINSIGISRLGGGADVSSKYLVFGRREEDIATVPYRDITRVELYMNSSGKPISMGLHEFLERQESLLKQ